MEVWQLHRRATLVVAARPLLSGCAGAYRWLKRLRLTPNSMWMTPRITDIFILNEFRKVSLLAATFQICTQDRVSAEPLQNLAAV